MFNTYGELANKHLLHMYGFAEPYPQNHYDTVSSAAIMIIVEILIYSFFLSFLNGPPYSVSFSSLLYF